MLAARGRPARALPPPPAAAAAVTLLAAALARRAAGSGGFCRRLGSAGARRPRCCRSQSQDAAGESLPGELVAAALLPRRVERHRRTRTAIARARRGSPRLLVLRPVAHACADLPPAILPAFCPTSVVLGHPGVRASRRRRGHAGEQQPLACGRACQRFLICGVVASRMLHRPAHIYFARILLCQFCEYHHTG